MDRPRAPWKPRAPGVEDQLAALGWGKSPEKEEGDQGTTCNRGEGTGV